MQKKYKAVLFDLDGTLADTIPAIRISVNETRALSGMPPLDYEGIRAAVSFGSRQLVIRTVADPARAADEAYIDGLCGLYAVAYQRNYLKTDIPYDGMREAVASLRADGVLIAVLTNKPDRYVRPLIAQLFGEGVFGVARGPVGSIVKPDPRLTMEVVSLLDPELTPGECVLVGDSDIDILTAQAAGTGFIGAAWGYRGGAFLRENGAAVIADAPCELPGLIL